MQESCVGGPGAPVYGSDSGSLSPVSSCQGLAQAPPTPGTFPGEEIYAVFTCHIVVLELSVIVLSLIILPVNVFS